MCNYVPNLIPYAHKSNGFCILYIKYVKSFMKHHIFAFQISSIGFLMKNMLTFEEIWYHCKWFTCSLEAVMVGCKYKCNGKECNVLSFSLAIAAPISRHCWCTAVIWFKWYLCVLCVEEWSLKMKQEGSKHKVSHKQVIEMLNKGSSISACRWNV